MAGKQTWLPWCERIDGPYWKRDYPGIAGRTLDQIEGDVKHSAEGPYSALLAEINHATRTASWTFSVSLSGHVVQHYPLEAITWHCGRKGDLDPDTEVTGNIALVGIEHAGKAVEGPLTTSQILATIRISLDIRRLTYAGTFPPEEAVNLWEHNWINPNTACPSNRVDWVGIIKKIEQEENLASIDDTRDWLGDEKKRTGHDAMKRLNDRISWHANRMTEHLKSHTTGSTSTKDGRHIHEG